MLIDVNAFCGRWPFAPRVATEPGAVADALAACGVTEAHVAAVESVLSPDVNWEEQNLARQLAGQDVLVHSPIVHPLRRGWKDALKRAADHGSRLVKLTPSYHDYAPDAPQVVALIEAAHDLGLAVGLLLRIEDERRHHVLMSVSAPSMLAVQHLAERIAPTPLLLLNAYYHQIVAAAKQVPNLRFDTAFCEYTDPVPDALAATNPGQLMFGSCAPLLYPRAQRMKLDCSTLSDGDRAAISAGNAQALFGG